MLQRTRGNRLGVMARHHGTARVIQHLCRRRSQQHPAEHPRMRRHQDQIESATGNPRDLPRRIACHDNPRHLRIGKFLRQKSLQLPPRDLFVIGCDLRRRPHRLFEPAVASRIEHVQQGHPRPKQHRRALHVRAHPHAGRRKIHRKQNVCDQAHRSSIPKAPLSRRRLVVGIHRSAHLSDVSPAAMVAKRASGAESNRCDWRGDFAPGPELLAASYRLQAASLVHRVTCCTRTGPLPLLPSGPGGVGGIASRRTRHTRNFSTA